MSASYPSNVRPFTVKADLIDRVLADHVNALQEEVATIETFVGLNPHVSSTPNPAGTFNAVSTTFASLAARLTNIETGVVADSHAQYVKGTGGAVVTTSTNSVVPLTVTAKSGQTADIFRVTGAAGTPVYFQVSSTGDAFFAGQSLPQGRLASSKLTSLSGSAGAGLEIMMTAMTTTFTAVAGRKYVLTFSANIGDSANTGAGATVQLHDGTLSGNASLGQAIVSFVASSAFGGTATSFAFYLDSLSAGSHSLTIGVQSSSGSGRSNVVGSTAAPSCQWVVDIGT